MPSLDTCPNSGPIPTEQQTSPFFTLPAELRNRIYQLINSPSNGRGGNSSSSSSSSSSSPSSPSPSSPITATTTNNKNHPVPIDRLFTQPGYVLTQVSTQIRAEASPVFFACNTFKFYLCFAPPRWLFRVQDKFLAFVSFIVLEDYQSEGWHPTPVCQSRIEIDLARGRDGGGGGGGEGKEQEMDGGKGSGSVVKHTDRKCPQCERRRYVRPAKLEEIVRGMRVAGEGGVGEEKQSPKLTREALLAMFDAARFNYGEESRLAGIDERVIE